MENENVIATPEVVPAPKKEYRTGSFCAIIKTVILNMQCEFNVHDIVNKLSEECLKMQKQPGNGIRNARLVVTSMLKDGVLVKVSRGRWKKV